MTNTEHPFKPGTRVAVRLWRSDDYSEGFVDKVHKSGRFTLKGSAQQWRASQQRNWGGQGYVWSAYETRDGWSKSFLKIWDETTDVEIQTNIVERKRRDRYRVVQERIKRLKESEITDTMLDAIEVALCAT